MWVFGVAAVSACVSVLLGAGGDIVALSLFLFVVPLFTPNVPGAHAVGSLVSIQGFAATTVGGLSYGVADGLVVSDIIVGSMAIGGGALAGSIVSHEVSSSILHLLFAVLTTSGAIVIGRQVVVRHPSPDNVEAEILVGAAVSPRVAAGLLVIGCLTGALGIGGGFLIVALLTWKRRPFVQVRGLALVLTAVNLLDSFVGHVVTTDVEWSLVAYGFAGAVVAAGAALTVRKRMTNRGVGWGLMFLVGAAAVLSWFAVAS